MKSNGVKKAILFIGRAVAISAVFCAVSVFLGPDTAKTICKDTEMVWSDLRF